PPLLFGGSAQADTAMRQLECEGPPIGVANSIPFENTTIDLPAFARLLIYSDGAVEVGPPDGEILAQGEFNAFVAQMGPADAMLDLTLQRARDFRGDGALNDDCSVIRVDFL